MRFVEPEMGGILVKNNEHTNAILMERFGKDSLMALATVDHGIPSVRTVNAVYIDSAFYVVTYALSAKMQQIAKNPTVAVCGEWFTAHGVGENLGHVLREDGHILLDAYAQRQQSIADARHRAGERVP